MPTSGSLTLHGDAVSIGDEIAAADLDDLEWTPVPDTHGDGLAQLTYSVTDDTGATSASDYTLTFDVENVNDAPTAKSGTISMKEDKSHVFSADDFRFTDPDGDGLAFVIISTVPKDGTFTVDGKTVTAGHMLALADIGTLVWTPEANSFGKSFASFTFNIVDDGGRSNGGENRSIAAATIAINVSDVIDRLNGTARENTIAGTMGKDLINGLGGDDILLGAGGNDVITGGSGSDRLFGNTGADRFVFSGRFGKDIIDDFDATSSEHDVLDFQGGAPFSNWKDLVSHHMQQVGNDVVIDAGSGTVTLNDVWIRSLDKSDFLL
jgi:Bacterial Ig domain/RTX calcium-binding nonapeptide repeat (4 copies)